MLDSKQLRSRREKLGLSRAALAKQIAVDGMTVYRWEVGLRSPSLEMIDRLAEALGISPRKLLRAEPSGWGP